jgi:3-oxoacyl-[acyl-carrier protein] reductase
MNVNGKTALVTGGATGIGRACGIKLAALGAAVVINYSRSAEEARATVGEIEAAGGRALAVKADVADDRQTRAMAAQAMEAFGSIDVLVNSAGRTHYIDLADLDGVSESQWDDIMDTNVKGAFFATRACAAELKKNSGCVIIVSSIGGYLGRASSIPYAVSKGALTTLTKCLARALAPSVRVNAVAPGIVNTRWVAGKAEHVKRQSEGTLLGRVAEADDVAEAILGLILHGDFVTGQTLITDGGFYL